MSERDRSGLDLRLVAKSFGAHRALDAVSIAVQPGEIVAITGPSGAGKTTIGRIIAGVEHADSGEVRLDGRPIGDLAPQARNVAMMFESYALYPHLSVRENLLFPLGAPSRRIDAGQGEAAVRELLELVEMADLAERHPSALSGGQRQRVALCRCLIQNPSVFVLDEPISHLDAKLRHKLRGEIRRRLAARAVPTLWLTPDAMEGMAVGDRVGILIDGGLVQLGTPADIYAAPTNVAVARLVGDPPMNLLRGRLQQQDGALLFQHPRLAIELPEASRRSLEGVGGARAEGLDEIVLGVRPAQIELGASLGDPGTAAAEVYAVEPFGKYVLVTVTLGEERIRIKTPEKIDCKPGERLAVRMPADRLILFDPRTGQALGNR
jgi:ABC-type sugar transport system ATPase subunit